MNASFLTKLIMITCILCYSSTTYCFSQEPSYDIKKGEYKRRSSDRQYVVGKIVNIAHELQHRPGGSDAQDSLFSKGRQGLMTSASSIWTFVDNIKGQDLQWNKEYLGKFVKIYGWLYHDAQYIEVDSFSTGGAQYEWSNESNSFKPTRTPVVSNKQ